MTTVQDIITRAGRLTREVSEASPALEAFTGDTIGLNAFNAMMREMTGVQIGQPLTRNWTATAGDTALVGGLYALNVTAPYRPANGARFGVVGIRTVTATDDTIEAAASVVTTESTSWFYREDLADWYKEADRVMTDLSPLAPECDTALAAMLAVFMWVEGMGELPATLAAMGTQGRNRIRQMYSRPVKVRADAAVLRGLAQRRFGVSAI